MFITLFFSKFALPILNFKKLNLFDLQQIFAKHKNISACVNAINKYKSITINGLVGSAPAMFLSTLNQKTSDRFIYILNDLEDAGYCYNDLVQINGNQKVMFFPSVYKRAIKYGQIDSANEILRTEVLTNLQQNQQNSYIIVTYPEALLETVVAKNDLKSHTIDITVNQEINRNFITEMLDEFGFEYVDYVYEPGQYALRGSILDIFSFSSEFPYRIDFFGNEVSSIRTFDITTQLSKEQLNTILVISDMQKISTGRESLLKMVNSETLIVFKDYSWCYEKAKAVYADTTILSNAEYENNIQCKLTEPTEFKQILDTFKHLYIGSKQKDVSDVVFSFQTELQLTFHKNFDLIAETFKNFQQNNYTIYLLSDSNKQQKRLFDIFEDRGDQITFVPIINTLSAGFIDKDLKICCFTDHQLFDRFHKYNLKSDRLRSGKLTLSLKELQQFQLGDYIVHIDHGVGRFGGLVRSDINGKMQELIKLTYLNNDTIFVSLHSLHKISKYKGKEGEPPRINKLGTGAWDKLKNKTKSKIKDIARDLISLYAKRQNEIGFQFNPDSFLQKELEASFIYEDTPDQLKATIDVKQDMESLKPMDRLICGDVGFGKTEIAVRAAFKAVTDNKQVAVLVPTTILAYQHYQTFKERLKDFPCRIDYISRARSTTQIKQILEDLKDGKIDILVGTHRIVGKDIQFKDFGLLIIDEEQKFGVAIKDKLKQLKSNVDTLTMSATPIPRTLQFSLMGARDLSSITTPPPNRYPIQTEVHTFDTQIIKEAIEFEMSRNGQVFFVNNRINNLYELQDLIKREVPDARIAVGHGQMDPNKLEDIITDFINQEYDVLLATSIIEAGIDVPNANTIIINNAQQFGLSDLHQLRGRVGRSNKKAFAYLLAPPLHTLTPEARRRLQAIENFSELGNGIYIAMQDLDIRGAGNLLGAEQSGFIADLGYEVYQKILKEAINELKNEEFVNLYHQVDDTNKLEGDGFVDEVLIDSDLELLFPATYIPNDSERITIYRELDTISENQVENFVARLKDRFGEIPIVGIELIRIVTLRELAKKLGIEKVVLKNKRMSLILISNTESSYYKSKAFDRLIAYIQNNAVKCEIKDKNGKYSMIVKQVSSVEDACHVLSSIMQD